MNKGDTPGGFLSRMARLVAPHSDEVTETAGNPDSVRLARQALKAIIERKRRNDEVRRREFDFLRDIFYRKRALQDEQGAASSSGVSSLHAEPDSGKAQTIEKIARIEAQMSQHWLQRQGTFAGSDSVHKIAARPVPAGRLDGGVTAPAHLKVHAPQLPIDLVGEDHAEPAAAAVPAMATPAVFSDAAVQFAKGDDAGAERSLRALMAQEVGGPVARSAWLALLDLCHAAGQVTRFEDLAAEYAERFHCVMPHWPATADLVDEGAAVSAPVVTEGGLWCCPALLNLEGVEQLRRLVGAGTGPFWLDWSELVSADIGAAQALLAEVQQWLVQPLSFRLCGGGILRRRLKASTPSGRRENEQVWWHLRLALLRLMGRADEFDLAALDYCVTYGVLPPNWVPPLCVCEPVESVPALASAPVPEPALQAGDPSPVLDWPPVLAGASRPVRADGPVLAGVWQGDLAPALAALDQELKSHPRERLFAIDCQQLQRMDFVAASALLQWLLGVLGQGWRVELRNVGRLLAAFFHVVGIDDVVPVRLRQY
ncbi:MAG TPA: STAS domain-containing protein [Macromonas sp.]|nr:STAS domain-containing protein [Macromonas sp.]